MKKITFILFLAFFLSGLSFGNNAASLSFAAGQMMMVGFNGTQISETSPIVKAIRDYHIGGVILVSHKSKYSNKKTSNIVSPEQLKQLIQQLQFYAKKYHDYPLLIAVNQEGGFIKTLKPAQGFATENDISQYAMAKKSDTEIFKLTYERAMLLKEFGINVNLAPVADLTINPTNPAVAKLERGFGANPNQVSQQLAVAVSAYKKANILCTLKHFPGLGSAENNPDYGSTNVSATWRSTELTPYEYLISHNKICEFVMVTHSVNNKLDASGVPASLSKKIIADLLIKKMHYDGLVITDDMDALAIREHYSPDGAIKQAIIAGNNVIIYGGTQGYDPDEDATLLFKTLMQLANTNADVRANIYKSYAKIKEVKHGLVTRTDI